MRLVAAPLLLGLVALGCQTEPTFVITFAPQDQGAPRAPSPTDAGRVTAVDAGLVASRDTRSPSAQGSSLSDASLPVAAPARPADPCKADKDCKAVDDGCCGCNWGGKRAVIARARLQSYEKERERCKAVRCMAVMSSDPTCEMEAACREGKCVLVAGTKKK